MTRGADDGLPRPDTADMGQRDLIQRVRQVLAHDSRVLGVWLVGSYARGTNDRFSDVDILVVVRPADVDGFCDDWPRLCAAIGPAVLQRQVGDQPIFNQITPDWLRYDVSVGTPEALARRTRSTIAPLYDPTGLSTAVREPGPVQQPNPDRIAALGQEFLRVLGLLPVVIGREEFVVGQSGAGLLRSMLIDLMLEDVAVEHRAGALHLNRLLPAHRRQILTDLPSLRATREAVIAGHVAFLPLARDLHARCDLDWPQELEDAARRYLNDALSVELPA